MMVTDLQGFESSILTDPQIHCVNKDLFGRGNLGRDGMDMCFSGHSCSEICAILKLKPHPMQLALDGENTSVGSGRSASSTPSSTHGSQICELCGALFKLREQDYLDTINKYQVGATSRVDSECFFAYFSGLIAKLIAERKCCR